MLIFPLKKQWYEKIKSAEKTLEAMNKIHENAAARVKEYFEKKKEAVISHDLFYSDSKNCLLSQVPGWFQPPFPQICRCTSRKERLLFQSSLDSPSFGKAH